MNNNFDELDDDEIDRLMSDAHDNSFEEQEIINKQQERVDSSEIFVVR